MRLIKACLRAPFGTGKLQGLRLDLSHNAANKTKGKVGTATSDVSKIGFKS
jgi:hypothetical protein